MTAIDDMLVPTDDDSMFETHGDDMRRRQDERTVAMAVRLYNEAASGLAITPDGTHTLDELRIRAGRRYMGDQWDTQAAKGRTHQSIPKVQNAVMTQTATQNEQSPQIKLSAVETDSPPVYYLSRRGWIKLQVAIQEGRVQTDVDFNGYQNGGIIDDEQIGVLLETLTVPQMNAMTGEYKPILVESEDVLIVNDATHAEALQTIFDRQKEEGFWDFYWLENSLMCNTFGDQPIVFQWDTLNHRGTLHNPNYTNVLHDPISTWVHNSRYEILTEYVSASRAMKMFPEFAGDIATQSQSFNSSVTDHGATQEWGWGRTNNYGHVEFDSSLVAIRTFWVRDVPYRAMEEGDAVAAGIVAPVDEPQVDEFGEPLIDEAGEPMVQTSGYVLVDSGEPTAPGEINWPTEIVEGFDDYDATGTIEKDLAEEIASGDVHLGIRQFKVLVGPDRVLEDVECPYTNIPMTFSKNIPIPYSPHGLGEPVRLESLMHAYDVTYSIVYDGVRYDGQPQNLIPASLAAAIDKSGAKPNTPASEIVLDDDTYKELRSIVNEFGFAVQRKPFYTEMLSFLDFLSAEIDKLSNNTEAIQGNLPSNETSGRAIEALQSGTRGLMKFKSETLQMAVEWVGRLWVDAIVNWLPDAEWDRYLSRYPAAIRQHIRDKARTVKYDVRAEVVAGRGASRRAEQEKAFAQFDRGALSKQSLLERMDDPDPKGELQRITQEKANETMPAGPAAPVGQASVAQAGSTPATRI